jgi:hypothetical protein
MFRWEKGGKKRTAHNGQAKEATRFLDHDKTGSESGRVLSDSLFVRGTLPPTPNWHFTWLELPQHTLAGQPNPWELLLFHRIFLSWPQQLPWSESTAATEQYFYTLVFSSLQPSFFTPFLPIFLIFTFTFLFSIPNFNYHTNEFYFYNSLLYHVRMPVPFIYNTISCIDNVTYGILLHVNIWYILM